MVTNRIQDSSGTPVKQGAGGTAASRHVALGWAGSGGETQLQRLRRVAYPAPPAPLLVARGRDLKPGLKMPLLLVGTLNIDEDLPDLRALLRVGRCALFDVAADVDHIVELIGVLPEMFRQFHDGQLH